MTRTSPLIVSLPLDTRFLVVRDPAERLVSAFLNKCVADGYMR